MDIFLELCNGVTLSYSNGVTLSYSNGVTLSYSNGVTLSYGNGVTLSYGNGVTPPMPPFFSNSGKYQTTWEKLLKGLNLNHFCSTSYCTITIMIHVQLYMNTGCFRRIIIVVRLKTTMVDILNTSFCLYFIAIMTCIKHKYII